jgi:hypothetical protein
MGARMSRLALPGLGVFLPSDYACYDLRGQPKPLSDLRGF